MFDTSVIKPYLSAYESAKKQLEQYYEMGLFPNVAITDEGLKKGQFEEGSVFFNYELDGVRKSVRIIPYMNQRIGLHAFKHPIVLDTRDMATVVVFNANPYGQLSSDGVVRLRQSSIHQFNFMMSYACVLGKAACGQINSNTMLGLGHICANTAAVCLSQALARSYSLDYSIQLNIQAVAAYYYYRAGLSLDPEKAAELSSLSTKVPLDKVNNLCIGTAAQDISNVPELAMAIGQVCESERLVDLKPVVIYTVLKQYWLGENGAELVCAAYEMPHVWAFLCFSSMEHVLYKKNQLSDILKISSKHYDAQQLAYRMRQILSNESP